MNQQTHFDHDDADLEALLRATFRSETSQRVPDSRAVPPFPATERLATVHPLRRKWTGVVLVAAALVGIVVGGSVIGHEAMDAKPKPVPPATTGVPEPTITSVPTTSTPTTPSTTASSPSAVTTKQLVVDGVTLTVPTSWGVQPLTDGPDYGRTNTCLAVDPSAAPVDYDASRCALVVSSSEGVGRDPIDSRNYDVGLSARCGEQNATLSPLTEDAVTIDGQPAEHRTWSSSCLPSDSIETWTVPTWPLVQFTRIGSAADDATVSLVEATVANASLPRPVSSMRAVEVGYPVAVDGTVLSVDRITVIGSRVVDNNPTTYDYPIASDAQIYGARSGNPSMVPMTLDQLRDVIAGRTVAGFLPLDQVYVYVQTDGHQATFVALRPRSQLS